VWLIPIADERVGVQVKLWNPLRTRAIPERFCSGDSLRRGAVSSVCTFTVTFSPRIDACIQWYFHTVHSSQRRQERVERRRRAEYHLLQVIGKVIISRSCRRRGWLQ